MAGEIEDDDVQDDEVDEVEDDYDVSLSEDDEPARVIVPETR